MINAKVKAEGILLGISYNGTKNSPLAIPAPPLENKHIAPTMIPETTEALHLENALVCVVLFISSRVFLIHIDRN